jgi:hypothetical protein
MTELRGVVQYRNSSGRSFTSPILLGDGRNVRIFIDGPKADGQPFKIAVVDEDGQETCCTNVMDNSVQIFRSLGLLIHLKATKSS